MAAADNVPALSDLDSGLDFGTGGDFHLDLNDMGKVDSLRFTTMTYVVEEKYDQAAEAIDRYVKSRKAYPQYYIRTERLARHAVDLVYAVRAKRSLPGLGNLSASKQQEIFDRAREHFEELKETLKRMEQVESDLRRSDLRSTIWVLNSLTICVFSLVAVGFTLELTGGLLQSLMVVIERGVDWLLSLVSL